MTRRKQLPIPPPSSNAVSRSMKGNTAKNTVPEVQVRALLRSAGFPGYRLHWRGVPGRPDIAFPGRRVGIFVNGCFWHRCPHCRPTLPKSHTDFWRRKFELNRERDRRKVRELRQAGWTVETVWECQIRDRPTDVLRRLVQVLDRTR